MSRQPLAENRLPSQRASVETRDVEAKIAALEVECTELRDQLRVQTNLRNSAEAKVKELKEELKDLKPPTLDGKRSTIGKLKPQGSPFYDHVGEFYKFLVRYDEDDVVPLVISTLGKVGREKQRDLVYELIVSEGVCSAREALLHRHEKQIVTHLEDKVCQPREAAHCLPATLSARFSNVPLLPVAASELAPSLPFLSCPHPPRRYTPPATSRCYASSARSPCASARSSTSRSSTCTTPTARRPARSCTRARAAASTRLSSSR